MGMTTKQIKKATLTETLSRLAESIHASRCRLTVATGIPALAVERMLHADERSYLAALADYRAITHPHASIPVGCGLY